MTSNVASGLISGIPQLGFSTDLAKKQTLIGHQPQFYSCLLKAWLGSRCIYSLQLFDQQPDALETPIFEDGVSIGAGSKPGLQAF
jgi:hypothetical protein